MQSEQDYILQIEHLQKGAKQQLENNDPNYTETIKQLEKIQSEYKLFLKNNTHAQTDKD